MTLFQNKYRIESTRYKGWDYSSEGSYFITICTQDRDNLFGCVVNGKMELNQYGNIVNRCWFDLPNHYQNIRLDAFKTFSGHRINELRMTSGKPVWQPRFHDHIIRDDDEFYRIKKYIIDNPINFLEH